MSQGGTSGILIGNGSESGGCLGSSDKSKGLVVVRFFINKKI